MKRILRAKRGTSLIEIVVSLAIISLLGIFFVSALATSLQVIRNNAAFKVSQENASSGIENSMGGFDPDSAISVVDSETGSLQMTFGGNTITVPGTYVTGSDDDGNAQYHYFNPG